MKKIAIIPSFLLALSLFFTVHAQDQTFATLDFLEDYEVQHIDYQCVLVGQDTEFKHADCVIRVIEQECVDANANMAQGREAEKCTHIAYRMWDAKLNEYYGRLMDTLPTEGQEALREAQRAWLDFHAKDSSSLTEIWQLNNTEVSGTLALLVAQSYKTSAIRERSNQLFEMLNFLGSGHVQ